MHRLSRILVFGIIAIFMVSNIFAQKEESVTESGKPVNKANGIKFLHRSHNLVRTRHSRSFNHFHGQSHVVAKEKRNLRGVMAERCRRSLCRRVSCL